MNHPPSPFVPRRGTTEDKSTIRHPSVLLGIGNPDRGDDGVGPYVASLVKASGWLCYDVGTAPENFTGVVRKHQPERLVLVDAADMGSPPGTIRRIPRDKIQDVGWGTHQLPLYHVIDYLADTVTGSITLIGIQPANTDYGAPMSPEVRKAAAAVARCIDSGSVEDLPVMT